MNNKYMMMANQLMNAGYMPQSMAKPMGMPQQLAVGNLGMQQPTPFMQPQQNQMLEQMLGPSRGNMGGRNFGQTRNIRS